MIIATTHKNTDFDALASVIGATLLYPECIGVVPKMTNRNVEQFLSTHKTAFSLILPNEVDFDSVKKLVVVDTNQWSRLDRMEPLRRRQDLEIEVWDHHMSGKGDILATRERRQAIGATITLLVQEIERRGIPLSPLDSTIMLLGLYEDTGHLSFPSTTADDARGAAFLLDQKADLNVAGFFLNPPYEETQKEILFEMMKETEKYEIGGHTIGFNCVQLDKKVTNLAAVVSMYRKIVNVQALFVVFTSGGERFSVIGRSGTDAIDIGQIMQTMGGGGHKGAGSASLKGKSVNVESIRTTILATLRETERHEASIADIMSFPVVTVSPDAPMTDVQAIMAEKKVRGLVVSDESGIQGIIVLWDLKKVKQERQWKSPVKAFMARNVLTIDPGAPPAQAAQLMIEKDVGYLPVVQEAELIGIVTRTDILTYYYDLLPQ